MAKKKNKELTIEEKLQNTLILEKKQPYKIPQNWCWVKINSISNIYTGNSINEKQVKEIAEKEIERVEDLKKNLLTRAFGGILGTTNPNEENSIELLKTVL